MTRIEVDATGELHLSRRYDALKRFDVLEIVADKVNWRIPGVTPPKKSSIDKMSVNIKDVWFRPPATIVWWKDGTKTVVRCQVCGDKCKYYRNTSLCRQMYSSDAWKESGLMYALLKKAYGNAYLDMMREWLK